MSDIFGGLIEFSSNNEMDIFLSQIDDESALKMIESALEFVQRNGTFTLQESYILHTCLKKLKNSIYENNSISDNDNHGGTSD